MKKQTTKLDALEVSVKSLSGYYNQIKAEMLEDNQKTEHLVNEKLATKQQYATAIKELQAGLLKQDEKLEKRQRILASENAKVQGKAELVVEL